jgi:predicted small lipoprotein YifL
MTDRHTSRRRTLLALALSGAIALGGTLSGCGQKGPLFLPKQQKTRVPATPSNPTPDATDTPGAPGAPVTPDTSPNDASPPTSDSTPPA